MHTQRHGAWTTKRDSVIWTCAENDWRCFLLFSCGTLTAAKIHLESRFSGVSFLFPDSFFFSLDIYIYICPSLFFYNRKKNRKILWVLYRAVVSHPSSESELFWQQRLGESPGVFDMLLSYSALRNKLRKNALVCKLRGVNLGKALQHADSHNVKPFQRWQSAWSFPTTWQALWQRRRTFTDDDKKKKQFLIEKPLCWSWSLHHCSPRESCVVTELSSLLSCITCITCQ